MLFRSWIQYAPHNRRTRIVGRQSGFVSLDGEFKFTSEKSWDGVNYGAGAKDGTLSTDGGAGNLKAEKGFYLLKKNGILIVTQMNVMTVRFYHSYI